MPKRKRLDPEARAFEQLVIRHLYYTRGSPLQSASRQDVYTALAHAVRDHLVDRWRRTTEAHYRANPKFVYYLSAEYLPGKQLPQNILYTGLEETVQRTLDAYGRKMEDLIELDVEPGLGNGGLGRLAACFLESLATLDIPAVGYGIRYEFGIFKQTFQDGWQVEQPDAWTAFGFPWEFGQPDDMAEVGFYGHTEPYHDASGQFRVRWVPANKVRGEPCTVLVPGYGTETVNILRLWRARATQEFDFRCFDQGDYERAVEGKIHSENLSKVLYPNDATPQGRELRLKQQYFFVACSLKDIIRRFHLRNRDWSQFPEKVAIQLNDTHPVIAIPELMRLLVDEQELEWERAWDLTTRTFGYTCHTLLPEALEQWPVPLFERLLPRHLEIIYEINRRLLASFADRATADPGLPARLSLIEEGAVKQVRMAHLAVTGCHAVNGVAELQSRLLREHTLRDFAALCPEKFQNKTNGVTPRRFLRLANPRLADLIRARIGDDWLRDLDQLRKLEPLAADAEFRRAWLEVKRTNKAGLAELVAAQGGPRLDPESLFDVMVKRLHEYKRQLLKALHIVTLHLRIKANPTVAVQPRTFVFGAKAAPGYAMAKLIIKLINNVAEVVNRDPDVNGRLRVVFLPNFNVSLGERIYPAADLSEQISLAGKEASGTGNMKFALNGALTVGTLDGANIEIRQHVGEDNFFLFGLDADAVLELKSRGYRPGDYYHGNYELRRALDALADGTFSDGDTALFRPLVDSLLHHDEYLLLADYSSYLDCQDQVAQIYADRDTWACRSILNTARCGFFSSDRTIREYCGQIWKVQPLPVPKPGDPGLAEISV
ncbi:MAG: glycogen/starch/alpha-glucan phosphorylase [Verrucomicrobia bacterium]|nr:glycogen/starch/alpha-glucan phosphorylase [Verrucomicrobiota bacterium]